MKNNKSHSHCDIKRNKSAAIRDTSKWHSQQAEGERKGKGKGAGKGGAESVWSENKQEGY